MIINLSLSKNPVIDQSLIDGHKRLDDFFGVKWERNKPDVYIVPDRKTIDVLRGVTTQPWVVGFGDKNKNALYFLDPKSYETESDHIYRENYFVALVKHELCHRYYINFIGVFTPLWLFEGVATYISGQLTLKKPIEKFEYFINSFDGNDTGREMVYRDSGQAVEILVKHFGKEKLLQLIKDSSKAKNKIELEKIFLSVYGFDLNYENFNNLIPK